MKNILSFYFKILIINILIQNISLAQKDSTIEAVVIREQVNPFNALSSSVDLKVSETLKYPGVFFDPARLAMAKAGVVNDNDQANGLSIRGNSPDALQWRLEGVEILNPNHLSNAANWNNNPATASGGVNMLSTQMLGTSSLLMGGYAAEYGNVQSGVMDMRLRAGATDRHRFVAQLGLVGIDLAAEGPISKNKRLTYSSNYRYSTVGLLSKLGVDFGDEKTAFQDFGVHLNYVGKKNWGAKVFYIKGNSNNAYHADLQKDSLISIRQLSDLDFRQKNKIIGFSANGKVAKTGNWKLSSVISRSDVENNWKIYNHEANNRLEDVIEMTKNHKLWSSMLSFSQRKENNIVKGGVFYESQFIDDKYIDALTYRKPKKTIDRMGFFFDVVYTDFDDKLKIQYGAHLDYFEETKQVINNSRTKLAPLKLSPRFAFSFSLNEKNTVGANVNYTRRGKLDNFAQFNISESNMNMLQWKHLFIKNAQLTVEVFYQRGKGISHDTLMTSNFGRGFSSQKSVNQGIATRFEQNFDNGSFVNANATWFRSTFQQEDKKWYSTKYDGKFASNLVYGKQWQRKRNTWGINSNLIFNGGQRDTPIDELNSDKLFPYSTAYLGSSFYTLQLKHYFRSDLRIYRTVKKKNYTATLSLDIQNVTNQQNVSFQYYDAIQKRIVSRYQTGLVPILNYRVAF